MEPLVSLGAFGLLAWGLVRFGGWRSRNARSIHAMLDDTKPCAVRGRAWGELVEGRSKGAGL